MNKPLIPKIESTGDIGIRSIKLVLRKNKLNEYRLSPVHDEEPIFCVYGGMGQSINIQTTPRTLPSPKRAHRALVDSFRVSLRFC
jgi:hypothetical protein